jgi:hypothetical protein
MLLGCQANSAADYGDFIDYLGRFTLSPNCYQLSFDVICHTSADHQEYISYTQPYVSGIQHFWRKSFRNNSLTTN